MTEREEAYYTELAKEYLEVIHELHGHRPQRQTLEFMKGEVHVLHFLGKAEGQQVAPGDISREMKISTARVAAALNSLEQKGMICRCPNPDDRRKVLVNLTGKGGAAAKQLFQENIESMGQWLGYLGKEDAGTLLNILKKLAQMPTESAKKC